MKIMKSILISIAIIALVVFSVSRYFITRGVQGIDVSHHNTVNWETVSSSTDIQFTFIKITEGSTFVDRRGENNITKAEEVGVKTGAYHYFSTQSSAQKQFQNFRSHFVEASSLVPMVDVEDKNDITMRDLNEKIKEFCLLIEEEYGCKPVIYTRPDLYWSVFMRYGFRFWSKYTFFFWQPIPIHPVFSTGRLRCLWQYSTNRDRVVGTMIIDKDVLSLIDLSELLRDVR